LLDDVTQTIERLATHLTDTFRNPDTTADKRRSSRQTGERGSRPNAGEGPGHAARSSAESRSPSSAVRQVKDTDDTPPPLERL
jgi:hypothetical protein